MSVEAVAAYRRFEIAGVAEIVEGKGGLPKVSVATPEATGEIYLHGAHVTSWKPTGVPEALFVSSQSRWEDGRAIRGGVPICFPWFGGKADDPKAPAHGFVRTKAWQLESISRAGNAVAVSMSTGSDEATKRWWPADFRVVYRATFARELRLELAVSNTGSTALRFEEALHAYFRVGNVSEACLHGLDGVEYLDKTDSDRKKMQSGEIAITGETDRVYLNTTAAIKIDDLGMRRANDVVKDNSHTTVVWNPWAEKARALGDLGDDQWRQMVCVETSNVGDFAVTLAPGERHTMSALVRVASS